MPKLELSRLQLSSQHLKTLRALLVEHVPDAEVWAYGSRVTDSAHEGSDLDLVLRNPTDLTQGVEGWIDLKEALQESSLPMLVETHLWVRLPQAFHRNIEAGYVVVQEGKKGLGVASEWTETTLGEAFFVNPSRSIRKGQITPFVPMDVLPENARTPNQIIEREFTGSGVKFKNGDTLIARITPCLENGKTAYINSLLADVTAHGSTEYIVLTGKPRHSENLFAYYIARSPEFRSYAISRMEGTSGRQRVPTSAVEKFRLALPPIEEQRAIAHILGTLDDKIELNRKQNETLEAMARALFKAWFVDFEPVRAKLEGRWQRGQSLPGLPAHLYDLFPDRFVDSELGEIPEGWEMRSLGQLLILIGGGTPKTSNSEYWDGDIPWFSVVDTPKTGDVFVVETEKSITQTGLDGSSARLVPKGTTIISARGTVGNLAIAGRDMTFNQSCYGLRGAGDAGDYFVYLVALQMVDQLKAMAHGSVFSTITRQTFDAIQRPMPLLATLQEFEKSVATWFETILSNVEESRSLAQLRDTLLPKLISGELRIKDAVAFLNERGL